ncbi:hypothetical protein NP493_119g04018 [Ridgeia piscesae]|uniref:Alkylated DNA repair protein AlkB homologue 8 N-terminal domain-containing protein n=1 Tax=Ridgeia piscesae TaxID=27915 RepID=A0AAD9P6A8_RIDPI|nr:hypothetical protein NP493_119g04018 [Ridgeia piscesae]
MACHAKLLGVTISQDLTWNKHVDNIVKKAGKRLYLLYQLKRAGITQKDLVSVYVSVVRPVLEYACPVWHTNLPQYLSDNIEVIQKRALKCIFPGLGYAEILRRVNLAGYVECKTDIKYNVRQQNVYPLPVTRTNRSVTPLYRGLYTTVSKKAINMV